MIEARKKAGLTQQELAARLSRPQSFVAKYEGGERILPRAVTTSKTGANR
jgi:ribosome-binding protein aMBF1 (putative translation factor)